MFASVFITTRVELKAQIFYFSAKSHMLLHLIGSAQIGVYDAMFVTILVLVLTRCFFRYCQATVF